MRTFVIADSSKRKAKPVGVLTWQPHPGNDGGRFALEVCSNCDAEDLPLSLSFCANRNGRRASSRESEEWVRSRIVPESRHNIAEVLKANGLAEYDEVGLLAASGGRSSDDDLLVYEVDMPQDFFSGRADALQAAPELDDGPETDAEPMADLVVGAVRRRHAGAGVTYAFVGFNGEGASADTAAPSAEARLETTSQSSAAQRIGSLIRAERKSQKLTQKQLAARAGITQTVLSRIESGAGNPTLALLEEIAAALGMQLDVSLLNLR